MHLHPYQRESLEQLLAPGVRTGGLQIPRGNAKSTTWAAVGLWALCDPPDAPQVPLIAYNGLQVTRTLLRPIRTMVRSNPELDSRCVVYTSTTDRRVWCGWNDGDLTALPADVERLQGLNPTVALVDESQTVGPDVLAAVMQGAGKRAESLVLAIGTPAPGADRSALAHLRRQAAEGAPVAWVEFAARMGCAIDDRREWRRANPALRAGLLFDDVLEGELRLVTEQEFRMYRLGQWIDAPVALWLPPGAWDACPTLEAPPAGADVVLALAGTWTSSVALVGCTPDGATFLAWANDAATDDELEQVVGEAAQRWHVLELVVAPRTRANLARSLELDGLPVAGWPNRIDLEVTSATDWRAAILEGRVPHDHDPVIAEHVANTVAAPTPDGSFRLGPPDDGRPIDAARAARMAWWRALELADTAGGPAIY
jgi:phage terminase large subunit-like protein